MCIENMKSTISFSSSFDEKFFTFCDKELTKINTFYAEKLAEGTRKFATLKSEMEESEKSSVTKKKVSFA